MTIGGCNQVVGGGVTSPPVSVATVTTETATTTAPASATTSRLATGDLAGWEIVAIAVGGIELVVALADTPADRAQGLMEVADLGDLGGMLFEWESPVRRGFWMKDTPMALDLAFFNQDMELVDWTSLPPCLSDPCPFYLAPARFQWVLETPAGSQPRPAPTDLLIRLAG